MQPMPQPPSLKPLYWVGSTLKDLRGSPEDVKDAVGSGRFWQRLKTSAVQQCGLVTVLLTPSRWGGQQVRP
jgi:hypothetical protein